MVQTIERGTFTYELGGKVFRGGYEFASGNIRIVTPHGTANGSTTTHKTAWAAIPAVLLDFGGHLVDVTPHALGKLSAGKLNEALEGK